MTLELHHVSKQYREHTALSDVTLSVPDGSVFALVGPNGAGKTTAIKILMNLIAPTQGRAVVLGTDSRQLHAREYARIGYVSENQRLPGRMRVGEYLCYLRPFYPSWDRGIEASPRFQKGIIAQVLTGAAAFLIRGPGGPAPNHPGDLCQNCRWIE